MPAPVSKQELKTMVVVPYQDIRSHLKSGDLLFTSGDYLISKAIKR